MTRLSRLDSMALVWLVGALFVATWQFFATFIAATLIAGLVTAMAMRSWHWQHPSRIAPSERPLRSEINLSSIPIRDDAGGLLFALGSMAILLGLPQLRAFLIGSLLCAALLALWLIARRRHASTRRSVRLDRLAEYSVLRIG
jgi:predicted branched-subunit amino acid permease